MVIKHMTKFIKKIISVMFLLFPSISFAAILGKTSDIFKAIGNLIELLIPIVFALALLLFFWGVAKYILSAGTEKDEGKKVMVWGVIALFVMSSIWGLTTLIRDELKIDKVENQKIPTLGQ